MIISPSHPWDKIDGKLGHNSPFLQRIKPPSNLIVFEEVSICLRYVSNSSKLAKSKNKCQKFQYECHIFIMPCYSLQYLLFYITIPHKTTGVRVTFLWRFRSIKMEKQEMYGTLYQLPLIRCLLLFNFPLLNWKRLFFFPCLCSCHHGIYVYVGLQ